MKKILFGSGSHVALRMTSLLPNPLGAGTRRNSGKRDYVLKHLGRIEYRTFSCANWEEAKKLEIKMKAERGPYRFST